MKKIALILIGFSSLMWADFTRDDTLEIVTDNKTTLQWQDNDNGTVGDDEGKLYMNWEDAISHCEALTLGDYDDWRLPNFNELISIIDRSTAYPAADSVFINIVATGYETSYWSSTAGGIDGYSGIREGAWSIQFDSGFYGVAPFTDEDEDDILRHARCVRDSSSE